MFWEYYAVFIIVLSGIDSHAAHCAQQIHGSSELVCVLDILVPLSSLHTVVIISLTGSSAAEWSCY